MTCWGLSTYISTLKRMFVLYILCQFLITPQFPLLARELLYSPLTTYSKRWVFINKSLKKIEGSIWSISVHFIHIHCVHPTSDRSKVTVSACTLIHAVQQVTARSGQLPLGSLSSFLFPSEIGRWRMTSVTPWDCSSKGDSSTFIDRFGYGAHTDCQYFWFKNLCLLDIFTKI